MQNFAERIVAKRVNLLVPAEILQPIYYPGGMGVAIGVNIKQLLKLPVGKKNVAAGIKRNQSENPPI